MASSDSPEKRSPIGHLVDWLLGRSGRFGLVRSIIIALSIALVVRWVVAEPYTIPSGSMEPTLHGDPRWLRGDRVFVNKWVYGLRYPFTNKRIWQGEAPDRFDIVVFKSVEDDPQHSTLVKRIIGLPGEEVQIRGGDIYINGDKLELPPALQDAYYTEEGVYGVSREKRYSTVPEGHYLVLGDNSGYSRDGRFFGWLPRSHIVGRVSNVWWPVTRLTDFTGFSQTLWWRTLITLLLMYTVWRMILGRSIRISGDVLGPEFAPKAHLYIHRIAFGLAIPLTRIRLIQGRSPRKGEIIAYYAELNDDLVVLAGRVAAVPDDVIVMRDDSDVVVLESKPELDQVNEDAAKAERVPAGSCFVIVDNPELLPDSRNLGFVPQRNLIGPATFVWWPPSRWGALRSTDMAPEQTSET